MIYEVYVGRRGSHDSSTYMTTICMVMNKHAERHTELLRASNLEAHHDATALLTMSVGARMHGTRSTLTVSARAGAIPSSPPTTILAIRVAIILKQNCRPKPPHSLNTEQHPPVYTAPPCTCFVAPLLSSAFARQYAPEKSLLSVRGGSYFEVLRSGTIYWYWGRE